jgi:hypothetical protein
MSVEEPTRRQPAVVSGRRAGPRGTANVVASVQANFAAQGSLPLVQPVPNTLAYVPARG